MHRNTLLKSSNLESIYSSRRKRILLNIKGKAALFCSAPITNRDVEENYVPNPDLFYLTGLTEPKAALLLLGTARGPRSIIFMRDRDLATERWTGERIGIKRARKALRVDEVRDIEQLETDLPRLISGLDVLYYAAGSDPDMDEYVWAMFKTPTGPRLNFPHTLSDARLLTAEMRLVKDREEIRIMKHAADITAWSYVELMPQIKYVTSEVHAARLLESIFARLGADHPAFPTIVAAGKNAVYLHHSPKLQPLWKKELVLIDAGASYRGYSSDVTRTVPVSGKFSGPQALVYDIVAGAARAAISEARPGSTLSDLHRAAAVKIAAGLASERIVKHKLSALLGNEKYKLYFIHRIGHWLGIDTHDIAPIHARRTGVRQMSHDRPFVPGNVVTVEPGLYFAPDDASVAKPFRGIGIRIEDDILITEKGCEVITARMPVNRSDLESLLG